MRTVVLVAKTVDGFVDPFTGKAVSNVACDEGIDVLKAQFKKLRDAGVISAGQKEVKLSEIRMLSTGVTGGELCAGKRFA